MKALQYRWISIALGSWLMLLLLTGCAAEAELAPGPDALDAGHPALPAIVSVDTVAELVAAEADVVVIDVREDWEFAQGRIPGARWLPMAQIPGRLDDIPRDVPVILACRSDNRSGQVYQFLRQQGFENVHNMRGGMVHWVASGHDIER